MLATNFFQVPRLARPLTSESDSRYAARLKELRETYEKGNLAAAVEAILVSLRRDLDRRCAAGTVSGTVEMPPGDWPPEISADDTCEIPVWLWRRAYAALRQWARTAHVVKGGRSLRWLKLWRQDDIDLDRWNCVMLLRSRGIGFTNTRQGGDLETLFDKAAAYITGIARGSPTAIRRSYLRVQKRMKTEPWRYENFSEIYDVLTDGKQPPQRLLLWYRARP